MKQQSNGLGTLLTKLETVIDSARKANLPRTAALLRLARLDLLLRIKGMAPDEAAVETSTMAQAGRNPKNKRKAAPARP